MVKNDNWVRATRRILRQVKMRVHVYVGRQTLALQEYERVFLREFQGDWKATSKSVLLGEVSKAKIVLGSDFHAFPQSQRTHLRILRELSPAREVVLALECVEARFQEWIDRFLAGRIGEKEFLERVSWDRHWGFPFENYRPLFEIARERGYQIRGINSYFRGRTREVLIRRDRLAAREILRIEKEVSLGGLVYVIFGEMHLASGHLPKMLKTQSDRTRRKTGVRGFIGNAESESEPLIIFQNSERLYYQLANGRKELRTNVLKRGKRKFCVMNAPPWVPWQHYALFLENSSDRDLEFEEGPAELEFTSSVHELLGIIGGQLGLKRKWDDYTVLPVGNRYLWALLKRVLTPRDLKLAESSLIKGRSLFFPQGGLMALARPTLNHAAQLCGQYIQSRLSGRTEVTWNFPEDFSRLIWIESLGFFGSKLINHRRQPEHLDRLKTHMGSGSPELKDILKVTLSYSFRELLWVQSDQQVLQFEGLFRPRFRRSYLEASRILGSILGERLYLAFRTGTLSRAEIKKMYGWSVNADNFSKKYKQTLKRVKTYPNSIIPKDEQL